MKNHQSTFKCLVSSKNEVHANLSHEERCQCSPWQLLASLGRKGLL